MQEAALIDAIYHARKALLHQGGIAFDKTRHCAVAVVPEAAHRARAYNILALEHARLIA